MKRRLIKTLNLLLISFILLAFITDQPLTQEYTVPVFARSICISDINQDGSNDIIVGNGVGLNGWGGISTILNMAGANLLLTDSVYVYSNMFNLVAFNANDNLFPDLVINGPNNDIRVYYDFGTTTSIYDSIQINDEYGFPDYITHGDVNGDGWQDIIIASNRGKFWGILFNNNGNGFSEPEYHFFDYPLLDISCADLTNDNQDEVIYTLNQYQINYYSYNNDSSFIIDSTFTGKIKASDFNNDGMKDVVCMFYAPIAYYSYLKFYKNLNNGYFEAQSYILNYTIFHEWEVADLNNDQLPDMVINVDDTLIIPGPDTLFVFPDSVITGYRINRFCVYYNLDNFQFSEPDTIYIRDKHPINGGSTGISLACGDINGDGYTDLAYTRYIGVNIPNLVVLYNNGEGRLTSQNLPTGIIDWQQSPTQALTCYPNPFTDQTTIEFQLDKPAEVSLIICDISGRIVKQIINNQKLNEGNHNYQWNVIDSYEPGVYMAQLSVNGNSYPMFKIIKL